MRSSFVEDLDAARGSTVWEACPGVEREKRSRAKVTRFKGKARSASAPHDSWTQANANASVVRDRFSESDSWLSRQPKNDASSCRRLYSRRAKSPRFHFTP